MFAVDPREDFLALGYSRFGCLGLHDQVSIWWHAGSATELLALQLSSGLLLRGTKVYFLKSIGQSGETWARDLPALHDYLETHFPEMRLSVSHFRDISSALAERHLLDQRIPQAYGIDEAAAELGRARKESVQLSTLSDLHGGDELAASWLRREHDHARQKVERASAEFQRQIDASGVRERLLREYLDRGAACAIAFSVTSNVQVVDSNSTLRSAVPSILAELRDYNHYQVQQKLAGGRLNIQFRAATEPLASWIEFWLGGSISPRQLDRIGRSESATERKLLEPCLVAPRTDVRIGGAVREPRKMMAARMVSSVLCRLDKGHEQTQLDPFTIPASDLPIQIGLCVPGNKPVALPLVRAGHIYVSGITGSGKSYASRVIAEGAATIGQRILILDPRNQAFGVKVPEDRERILRLYPGFGLPRSSARGFEFDYYAPAVGGAIPLPSKLAALATARSVVSFRGMEDADRCQLFAQIMDAVFDASSRSESDAPRLLIVIEEAHRFTKRRVDDSAKSKAAAAERALDRTIREGRKYGCQVVILSQTIRDFAYDAASIRQNIGTRVFMANTDRELEYAADYVENPRALTKLPPGTGILCNASWGAVTARIRPPLSKVWEYSEDEIAALLCGKGAARKQPGAEAKELLDVIRSFREVQRRWPIASELAESAGITSKRRLAALLEELECCGRIRTSRLSERGRPRIVKLADADPIG